MVGISQPATEEVVSSRATRTDIAWLWLSATALPANVIWVALNLLIMLQVSRDPDTNLGGDNGRLPALEYILMMVLAGVAVAIAQWWVLKNRLGVQANNRIAWIISWAIGGLATMAALGGLTADTGNTGFEDVFARIPWLFLPGVVVGMNQLYILKTQLKLRATEWWVAACVVGWAVGALIGSYVHTLLFNRPDAEYNMPYYPAGSMWAWSAGWAVGVLIFGAITGICMAHIARRSEMANEG